VRSRLLAPAFSETSRPPRYLGAIVLLAVWALAGLPFSGALNGLQFNGRSIGFDFRDTPQPMVASAQPCMDRLVRRLDSKTNECTALVGTKSQRPRAVCMLEVSVKANAILGYT